MPHFDRYDICQAYLALEMDWNQGGVLLERPRNARLVTTRHMMSASLQLHRMGFKLGMLFKGYESLSDNGREIYDAFLVKHRMCSACDGRCVDKWGVTCDMRLGSGELCPTGSPGCDGESCGEFHERVECSICRRRHGPETVHPCE